MDSPLDWDYAPMLRADVPGDLVGADRDNAHPSPACPRAPDVRRTVLHDDVTGLQDAHLATVLLQTDRAGDDEDDLDRRRWNG